MKLIPTELQALGFGQVMPEMPPRLAQALLPPLGVDLLADQDGPRSPGSPVLRLADLREQFQNQEEDWADLQLDWAGDPEPPGLAL